jgi:hypothetical protein
MAFNVILEDEHQAPIQRLEDPKGVLNDVLPPADNLEFPFLRTIDPYGDTVFNRPQMEPFLNEWRKLLKPGLPREHLELLRNVEG